MKIQFLIILMVLCESHCHQSSDDDAVGEDGSHELSEEESSKGKCRCVYSWKARTSDIMSPGELRHGRFYTRPRKRDQFWGKLIRFPVLEPFIHNPVESSESVEIRPGPRGRNLDEILLGNPETTTKKPKNITKPVMVPRSRVIALRVNNKLLPNSSSPNNTNKDELGKTNNKKRSLSSGQASIKPTNNTSLLEKPEVAKEQNSTTTSKKEKTTPTTGVHRTNRDSMKPESGKKGDEKLIAHGRRGMASYPKRRRKRQISIRMVCP